MKTVRLSALTKLSLVFTVVLTTCFSAFARQDSTRYALVLEFYSIGTGTPGDQPLKDFVTNYRKQNQLKPLSATRVGGLGREGEYAIVFPLTELNTTQKKKFISALTKALPTLKAEHEKGGINLNQNQPFDTGRGRLKPETLTL